MAEDIVRVYSIEILELYLSGAVDEYERVLKTSLAGAYINTKRFKMFEAEKKRTLDDINAKIKQLRQDINMLKEIYGGNVQDPDKEQPATE